jgi:hypothetical protein
LTLLFTNNEPPVKQILFTVEIGERCDTKKNNALWVVTACSQVEERPENGGSGVSI